MPEEFVSNNPAVRPMSPIDEAISGLDRQLNALDTMTEELVLRLVPILSVEAPTKDPGDPRLDAVSTRSPHVDTIDRLTVKVRDLHDRLRATVERLDI